MSLWELALLEVETQMVALQFTEWPSTGFVGLLTFMDPMSNPLAEPTDIKGLLHGLVAWGHTAQGI